MGTPWAPRSRATTSPARAPAFRSRRESSATTTSTIWRWSTAITSTGSRPTEAPSAWSSSTTRSSNHFDQTDAIGLFQDFGVEADRLIKDNLLAGGGYTIYGGDNRRFGVTHDIQIVGNRISRVFFPSGGHFGPLASFDHQGVGNLWADNVWDEDGSPIP